MGLGGVRSRVSWGLFVCAVLVPMGACTAVAGIGGFGVDPCFDGCDGGALADAPAAETSGQPDAPPEASSDSAVEAGPCDCPSGTQPINGTCAVMGASPPSVSCATPVQLPNCAMKLVLHVCDTDPPFTIAESTCIGDGGATRPTGFLRLGTAPGGTWSVVINAAYSASRPNVTCTQGGGPCRADGTASSKFSTPSLPNGDLLALGKRSEVSPCQDILIEVTPN